ncbi:MULTISPECIES: flagellin [Chromobacterium]|uniref:Flagellin n=1 Tax=Chromobacterium haemolyticum TaxID=394935 RepID=A0A1W0D3S6_9NEIS|nr:MULTISPECIES: flagellin [Chromobacterium]MBK0414196.1 flagellin FliC [Chromobacterium haemolyticum]MBO0415575.1 flagellin FliC [Chromobacterium haemolyticum]MBO0498909.1 flagellin FliC [Chromobacterium haemolyticum]OQS41646.1 flagellin [Chromobacterium haemolyticum]QOZ84054.1 flagellin FliC [Chromobacterium sp. Rain0013]
MALTINSNLSALQGQNQLNQTQKAKDKLLAQLSAGKTTDNAANNPANAAISEALLAQINGNNQAINNANDGISLAQTADGALNQLQSNTQQIQELAIQAGNGALSASNRQALQQQVDQLTQANSAIVQSTEFNGTPLLNSNATTTFQVGPNGSADNQVNISGVNLAAAPASGGLNSYNANLNATGTIDISTQAGALAAQQSTNTDLNTLANTRSTLGSISNRFEASINNLQTASVNTAAANSRISDTDFAAATAQLAAKQILGQTGLAAQAQANIGPRAALSLLG